MGDDTARLLQQVVEKLPEGLLIISREGYVLFINHAAAELLDVGVIKPVGRHVTEVIRVASVHRFIRSIIEANLPENAEVIIDTSTGEKSINAYGAPLGQSTEGIFIAFNDVTQIKKLEKIRTDFVANVSHELKTPITIIRGAVETLLSSAPKDEATTQKFLSSIGRQTERLGKLFEDLLNLSRVEQDKVNLNIVLERRDLKTILEDCLADNRAIAETKGVTLELECTNGIIVFANSNLLAQAVQNLIQNALEYTPLGGTVTLIGAEVESMAHIAVRDTGCGIPEEHLPRIFERFYTVDLSRSRTRGGTGLGLSIVKHIAQVHGGSVTVMSSPGVGSEFLIKLRAVGA